jgi:hypothetical protein
MPCAPGFRWRHLRFGPDFASSVPGHALRQTWRMVWPRPLRPVHSWWVLAPLRGDEPMWTGIWTFALRQQGCPDWKVHAHEANIKEVNRNLTYHDLGLDRAVDGSYVST